VITIDLSITSPCPLHRVYISQYTWKLEVIQFWPAVLKGTASLGKGFSFLHRKGQRTSHTASSILDQLHGDEEAKINF
jgi:hypothetical protein